jgi:hypothetical protein
VNGPNSGVPEFGIQNPKSATADLGDKPGHDEEFR